MSAPVDTVKLKICMAGEAAVGKTSLIRRYVLDQYDDRYSATLGTKITKKRLRVKDPRQDAWLDADLILWDIMGASTLRELLKEAYYHGAQGILAVADLTRRETLLELDGWSRSIRSVAGDIPTYAVVNKVDLEGERDVPSSEVESFFRQRGWAWSYTSAKTGAGVEPAFRELVDLILADRSGVR